MPRWQHGHAYVTRWRWITRSCSGIRNCIELFAEHNADRDECVAVVGANTLGSGQFVPYNFARRIGIERFAVTGLLARVRGGDRFRDIFLSGRRIHAKHFGFVEQTGLVRVSRLALCAEQFAVVCTQPFFGEITLCRYPTERAANLFMIVLVAAIVLRCRRDAFLALHKVFRDPLERQVGIDPMLLRKTGDGGAGHRCYGELLSTLSLCQPSVSTFEIVGHLCSSLRVPFSRCQ